MRISKAEGEPMEEAFRERVVGASTSMPRVNVFENVGEFFTPPTSVAVVSA